MLSNSKRRQGLGFRVYGLGRVCGFSLWGLCLLFKFRVGYNQGAECGLQPTLNETCVAVLLHLIQVCAGVSHTRSRHKPFTRNPFYVYVLYGKSALGIQIAQCRRQREREREALGMGASHARGSSDVAFRPGCKGLCALSIIAWGL